MLPASASPLRRGPDAYHRPPMTDTIPPPGLSSAEAAVRRLRHGANVLAASGRRGLLRIATAVATEPMFLLLLVAAGVYLLLGDLGDGLLLAAFALLSVALVVMQERRSERALEALRDLAAPQVRVWRDGRLQRLPASELVPGDCFAIAEGERVAADALLLACTGLSVDESLLTGESVPVLKRAAQPQERADAAARHEAPTGAEASSPSPAGGPHDLAAGGPEQPWLHAGTLAVAGQGLAQVVATGAATRMGQIGASLATIEQAPTPLEAQLRKVVRGLAIGALGLSLLLVLWWGLAQDQWLQGRLSGIALAMAILPQEFPMALAVFLALGAWRLAQVQVLARRPAVIEALGATTVLCVDKTGTLTENRMRLHTLVATGATDGAPCVMELPAAGPVPGPDWPEPLHRLLEFAMLASQRGGVEPMDTAILSRGDAALAGTEHLHPDWLLARQYPLTADLLAFTQVWHDGVGNHRLAVKGAPEAVMDLCHADADAIAALRAQVEALAGWGLRVLAVAEGQGCHAAAEERPAEPVAPPDQAHAYTFRLLGLIAFEDPLRASVPAAVAQAQGAGIAVVMITGDYPATALAIAEQAGIDTAAGALTGEALGTLDDVALAQAVRQVRVFARVTPQDKLRLVRAFHANGEVVAMTGDGVNDAPALKAAHIGIAMGQRGTDVAREAASVVLLDEDFGRIVEGVRVGRRIFDNLRKVMTYILAIHVPIAGLALLPVLVGLPPLLLPVHVVITEMIIGPVCSLAFESAPPAPRLMTRPPRDPTVSLLDRAVVARALVQGACLLVASMAVYTLALGNGLPADTARALAFAGLTFGNLLLVALDAGAGLPPRALFSRDFIALWSVAAVATALIAAALAWPGLRALLHFEPPAAAHLALTLLGVGLAVLAGWALGRRMEPGQQAASAAE